VRRRRRGPGRLRERGGAGNAMFEIDFTHPRRPGGDGALPSMPSVFEHSECT